MLLVVFQKEALCGHVPHGRDYASYSTAHVISVWWTDAVKHSQESPSATGLVCVLITGEAKQESLGQGILQAPGGNIIGSFWTLPFNDYFNSPYSVLSHMLYDCKWHIYRAESFLYFTHINLL